jgi:hypothetical protein
MRSKLSYGYKQQLLMQLNATISDQIESQITWTLQFLGLRCVNDRAGIRATVNRDFIVV